MSVIQFPGQEEISYWRCACGCLTNYARSDGTLECANCHALHANEGAWSFPDLTEPEKREDMPVTTKIVDINDQNFAIKRILRTAQQEGVLAITVVHNSGKLTNWGVTFATDAQKEWLRERLLEAAGDLCERSPA